MCRCSFQRVLPCRDHFAGLLACLLGPMGEPGNKVAGALYNGDLQFRVQLCKQLEGSIVMIPVAPSFATPDAMRNHDASQLGLVLCEGFEGFSEPLEPVCRIVASRSRLYAIALARRTG